MILFAKAFVHVGNRGIRHPITTRKTLKKAMDIVMSNVLWKTQDPAINSSPWTTGRPVTGNRAGCCVIRREQQRMGQPGWWSRGVGKRAGNKTAWIDDERVNQVV